MRPRRVGSLTSGCCREGGGRVGGGCFALRTASAREQRLNAGTQRVLVDGGCPRGVAASAGDD